MADIDHGPDVLAGRVGEEIGVSEWLLVNQLRIDIFGAITDDLEPLHNDPAWCGQNSPYGKPIAYGFLTLSMLTHFLRQITKDALAGTRERRGFPLNYGFDRIRFIEPVLVMDKIRARMTLSKIEPRAPGWLLNFSVTVDIQDKERPALTAEWISLWVDGASSVNEHKRSLPASPRAAASAPDSNSALQERAP